MSRGGAANTGRVDGRMTKILYLMRHAKSDWQDPSLEDFDRPLNDRGRRTAPVMGAFLATELGRPDHVLCSAARRATRTWELIEAELGAGIPVTWSDDLYLASASGLLKTIVALAPPKSDTLLVIGHNPGLEQLAADLSGPGSNPKARSRLKSKFSTAAVAVLAFDVPAWTDLRPGHGRLTRFVRPKDLA